MIPQSILAYVKNFEGSQQNNKLKHAPLFLLVITYIFFFSMSDLQCVY